MKLTLRVSSLFVGAVVLLALPPSATAGVYEPDVEKLYVEYFARPADVAGLNYWQNVIEAQVAAGGTAAAAIDSISNAFGTSTEYTSQFAGLNSTQIVARVYQNLFSHDPDPSGLAYWSMLLENGSIALAQISRTIGNAAITAGNSDGFNLTKKIQLAINFSDALDMTCEQIGYSGATALGQVKAFLHGVTDAASFANAMFGLPSTVSRITGCPDVSPHPGACPSTNATGAPFLVRASATIAGALDLSWGGACGGSSTGFAVYEGILSAPFAYHHTVFNGLCNLNAYSAPGFVPGGEDRYYLVVPVSSANGEEGVYGYDSSGNPIPAGSSPCQPWIDRQGCP